jgi:hypothetical protein
MTKIRLKKGILGGIVTFSLLAALSTSAFAATSASQTVSINTIVDPTVTLAVSKNSINFGDVNPLTNSYEQDFTGTVQSNATFNLTALAAGDLQTSDATPKTISINHLGIKLQSDSSYKTMSKDPNNPVVLASSQPATAGTVYQINLQLNTDWQNAVPGSYSTNLTLQASQF